MTHITGYLTAVKNPNFSGIATVHIRSKRYPTERTTPCTDSRLVDLGYSHYDVGEVDTFITDAGRGVRFLAGLFDGFSEYGQHMKATFTLDEFGMLANVEFEEEDDV